MLSTGEGVKIQRGFKFENCWFLREDLEKIVARVWGQKVRGCSSMDRWQNRFGNVRKALKGWNINCESANKKARKKLTADIDQMDKNSEINGLSLDDWSRLQQYRNDLDRKSVV